MAFLAVFSIVILLPIIQGGNFPGVVRQQRISDGQTIDIPSAPFMALVVSLYIQTCSGTIISPHFVLTAGHCVYNYFELTVRTGYNINLKKSSHTLKKYKVAEVFLHEKFNYSLQIAAADPTTPPPHDIALVKVSEPIEFDTYRSFLPLATKEEIPVDGQQIKIYGYGDRWVGDPRLDYVLNTLDQVVIPKDQCKKAEDYKDKNLDQVFCAKTVGPGGACTGDSGGPAVADGHLVGVFSFLYGTDCNTAKGADLYTRVSLYYDWILSKTGADADFIKTKATGMNRNPRND